MIKKKRLALYTFISVFISILAVGGLVMPLVLDSIQKTYIELQADVNSRQAKAMAKLIESRISQGVPKDEVLRDFQASIAGSDSERGYICVIDQKTTNFLCHPMPSVVGQSVAMKQGVFDKTFSRSDWVPWETAIQSPQSSSGLLTFKGMNTEEVVHSEVIGSQGWVVNSHENTGRVRQEINQIRLYVIVGSLLFAFLLAFPISLAVRTVSRRYEKQIEVEQQKSDQLLLSILPEPIAVKMKEGEQNIVSHFEQVSILFCDIVGFTKYASKTSPAKLVKFLNILFSRFDALCTQEGVEKIKTIGDSYMAVCGLPNPVDQPVQRLTRLGLGMLAAVEEMNLNVKVRIGIHVGEVVAGVIGTNKFSYDLWGDTVNMASRLESSGTPGKIHISSEVKEILGNAYSYQDQGETTIKGKGQVQTWLIDP